MPIVDEGVDEMEDMEVSAERRRVEAMAARGVPPVTLTLQTIGNINAGKFKEILTR